MKHLQNFRIYYGMFWESILKKLGIEPQDRIPLVLSCCFILLAGASVMVRAGISRPAFYSCVYKGIDNT